MHRSIRGNLYVMVGDEVGRQLGAVYALLRARCRLLDDLQLRHLTGRQAVNNVSESDNKKWAPSVYTKLYRSIFDGSLYGQFEPLTTFMAMLALANQHGEVDASPERIAGSLGCKLEFVLRGIKSLEAPDKRSRTPDEDGRRIVRLGNEDGAPRPFGWRIVNYTKYRAIRNEEERRVYKRGWDRINRSRNPTNPTTPDRKQTHTEAEAEAEAKTTKERAEHTRASRLPPDWQPPEDLKAWALTERPDLDLQATTDSFRDYWISKPGKEGTKLDWPATFRNWVRKERQGPNREAAPATVKPTCAHCKKPLSGAWTIMDRGKICKSCREDYNNGIWQ